MRPKLYLTAFAFLALLLAGCGTFGGLGLGTSPEARTFIDGYRKLPERSLTANGTLTLDAGLEEQLTVPVQYINHSRLGVSLSVRPLGAMEAVRITVTDEEMLVLDRLNKKYARTSLDGLTTKIASSLFGFNPYAIRSVLGNEPFSENGYGADALNKLKYAPDRSSIRFFDNRPRIELSFDADRNLTRSYYEPAINTSILADYTDFRRIHNGTTFPSRTNLTIELGIRDYHFDLRLRDIRPYAGQEITTVPPAGYAEISISEMKDILEFVSKLVF